MMFLSRYWLVPALLATVLTPVVIRLSRKVGLVDRPDNHRKLHGREVPLGGGLVLLATLVGTLLIAYFGYADFRNSLGPEQLRFLIGVVLAGGSIVTLGLVDDRFGMRGRTKLAGQAFAVTILIWCGLSIEKITLLNWEVTLGLLAIPFTYFWLLGAINSLNFIDGADGLAASVGLILTVTVASLCFWAKRDFDCQLATIFAAALFGFLLYNKPPARIFLGDAGSMLIGLLVGAMAIRGSLKGPATVAMAVPSAIWAIPILDVAMAICRRKLTGRSLYSTDRNHIHHVMIQRGFNHLETLMIIGCLCLVCCLGALGGVLLQNELVVVATVAAVVSILVVMKVFGHWEFRLAVEWVGGVLKSFVQRRETEQRAATSAPWHPASEELHEFWDSLVEFAREFCLASVRLNISIPALKHDYHAIWKSPEKHAKEELWKSTIPLRVKGRMVGELQLEGLGADDSGAGSIGEMLLGLQSLERQLQEILLNESGTSERKPVPEGAHLDSAASTPLAAAG